MTGVDAADAATKKSDGQFRDRLHEVPASRRAERRAHRHRARLPRRRSRRRLGRRGRARRDAQGRRDASSTSATRNGCSTRKGSSTPRSAIPSSRRRSPSICRRLGPKYPKTLAELIDRANQFNVHCAPTARIRTRAAGRCSSAKPRAARWPTTVHVGARPRAADGPGRRRGHARRAASSTRSSIRRRRAGRA